MQNEEQVAPGGVQIPGQDIIVWDVRSLQQDPSQSLPISFPLGNLRASTQGK